MKQKSTLGALIWKTLEQYGVLGFQFILQILLARILAPEVYGTIAIIAIFISFSNVIIQKGFSLALLQKKEIKESDTSSVFYFSTIVALFFYLLLFIFSGKIAEFFHILELTTLLKVSAISLFPDVYTSIASVKIKRFLNFKFIFRASIFSMSISGFLALIGAYIGWGVWALIIQQLSYCFLYAIILFCSTKWLPKRVFRIKEILSLLSFGWKVLATDLINEFFVQIRGLVIGRKYSKKDLAFYSKGQQFPNLLMRSVNGSLQEVLLPKMSSNQNDKDEIKRLIHLSISMSSYILFPCLVFLALSSESLVSLLLTDKWLPIVPFINIFCIYYAFWPITTPLQRALYAIGKSKTVMIIEVTGRILDLVILLITVKYGVLFIAWGITLVSLLTMLIYMPAIRFELKYNLHNLFIDIIPSLLLSIGMGLIMYFFSSCTTSSFTVLLGGIVGFFFYFLMSKVLRLESLAYLMQIVKQINLKQRIKYNE